MSNSIVSTSDTGVAERGPSTATMPLSATGASPHVVEARGLSRAYATRSETVHALHDVSLDVARGEVVAVAGPSGSGKSTLLHLLGGLDRPDAGTVFIEGRDLARLGEAELSRLRRDRIGFVFQAYNLVPVMTALENVEYVMLIQGVAKQERLERAKEALASVGLQGKEARRPAELSGGQQQRVAIARAIAGRPALILADEPTANLDEANALSLMDSIADLNATRATTFVISTHDARVMQRATRIVALSAGTIDGTKTTTHNSTGKRHADTQARI